MAKIAPSGSQEQTAEVTCQLKHHGAAASSSRKVLTWIPGKQEDKEVSSSSAHISGSSSNTNSNTSSVLVYASHAIVNLAVQRTVILANGVQEHIWHVEQTLRTNQKVTDGKTVITALCRADDSASTSTSTTLACGFSDGSINVWRRRSNDSDWVESVIVGNNTKPADCERRAVNDLTAVSISSNGDNVCLVAGSSAGVTSYHVVFSTSGDDDSTCQVVATETLLDVSIGAVQLRPLGASSALLSIGTAAPRHNKIHVYSLELLSTEDSSSLSIHSNGFLSGHEDWITSLDWHVPGNGAPPLLASASQDAKVRLWKFTTIATTTTVLTDLVSSVDSPIAVVTSDNENDVDDQDDASRNDDEEEDQEGESRMEIVNAAAKTVTSVTLEALLIGHEECVTSVSWHPNPQPIYGHDQLLITSSMDRTILLWTPGTDGIWTPLSRVGSAGGILGGSVGSTLLGFVRTSIEPVLGQWLVGHAFGGALHVWSLDDTVVRETSQDDLAAMQVEDRAALVHWRATPCVTGHFGGVTDLCWESRSGDYLLTVSVDQTCRLWGPVPTATGDGAWVELARPQVHGYDLSAVASVSTPTHPHLLVSGADEKELRVFDAPKTTLRVLKAAGGIDSQGDPVDRTERAYIPSLGLSNQASAADGAEEDKNDEAENVRSTLESLSLEKMRLPLERDLGAVSLWPEKLKLFGHNSELFCLASTLAARTAGSLYTAPSDVFLGDAIVASSAKARDVDDASIRLWDVERGKCLQTLAGGHKSTVAALSFSPDGRYLASSGKDRRLCIWKKEDTTREFSLAFAKDSAHKRILWAVHFCPFDESILASGSRDGCIKVWKVHESDASLQAEELYSFAPSFHRDSKPDAVTALSFAPVPFDPDSAILALGLESGRIEVWKVPTSQQSPTKSLLVLAIEPSLCHVATVTKLAWKPVGDKEGAASSTEVSLSLASSSMDHGCRIFAISWGK